MRHLSALALLLALPLASTAAGAQTAALVEDLEPFAAFNPGSDPQFRLRVGQRALFEAFHPGTGYALWSTDGTARGTEPMPMLGGPAKLGQLLGLDLLVGRVPIDEFNQPLGLWLSDGTAAGTRLLVPGLAIEATADRASQDRILFFARGPQGGMELWKTDGRPGGERRVRDLGPRQVSDVTTAGRLLLFLASDRPWPVGCGTGDPPPACEEPVAWSLWVSDGTAAGTRQFRELGSLTPPGIPATIHGARGDWVYVSICDPEVPRTVLLYSNGTDAGTRQLAEYRTELGLQESPRFVELAGKAYFIADSREAGRELWVSDGTRAGTRRITDLALEAPFPGPLQAEQLALVNGRLVFRAFDLEHGVELWATDGRPESTTRLTDVCGLDCPAFAEAATLASFDGRVFAVARDEDFHLDLWVTDGTPAGSRVFFESWFVSVNLVVDSNQMFFLAGEPDEGTELQVLDGGAIRPRRLSRFAQHDPFAYVFLNGLRLGSRFVFAADDGSHGAEPWVAEVRGGPDSSRLITDLEVGNGPSSNPVALTRLGDRALFFACQGGAVALWSSTGVPGETRRLHTLAGPCQTVLDAWGSDPPLITVAGGIAYHHAEVDGQVWRTDGTPEGTFELTSFAATPPYLRELSPLTAFGDEVLFSRLVSDGTVDNLSYEIWASGGTEATTHRLFTVGPPALLIEPHGAADRFYFLGLHGATVELFVSDGAAGTRRLLSGNQAASPAQHDEAQHSKDKHNSFALGDPQFTRLGGFDYFRWGGVLWRTDGTPEGTENLSGLFTPTLGRDASGLTAWNGDLYLFSEAQLTGQRGLWRTDGTAEGTELLIDLGYGSTGALTPFRDALYFPGFASDGQGSGGSGLWRSDGTPEGTAALGLVFGGWGGAGNLVPFGDRLYFDAARAETSRERDFELWSSDGTSAGTGPAQDINPGPEPSGPLDLVALPTRLLFSADDGITGRELWALPLAGPACEPSETVLCFAGGRLRAEVVYQDRSGARHLAEAHALTSVAGAWSFFRDDNLDLFVKVLDGSAVNGRGWVFVGSLSDAGFALTLTDTATGATRRYTNLEGQMASFADTGAFDFRGALVAGEVALPRPSAPDSTRGIADKGAAACVPSSVRLCLLGGRFAVEIDWASATSSGQATMRPESDTSGLFWFLRPENLEGALKMLDGTPVNGHFWFFFTGLTDLELTIRVTDTTSGAVRSYFKRRGELAAFADTEVY